jgi:hypothetical protein
LICANEKGDNPLPAELEIEVFDLSSMPAVGRAGGPPTGARSVTKRNA